MRTRWIQLAVVATLVATSTLASAEARTRKPLRQMTCGDFLLVDDGAKPEIVYWMATRNPGGAATAAVIDVGATDGFVPTLVEKCKEAPWASLWPMVTAAARTLERELPAPSGG